MAEPTISIIVPVYKTEAYLEKCVDSILAQTFRDFELLLIDDGSPDNCPALCEEAAARDPRIRVIHQKNAGLSAARNTGVEAARGEWIGFVDSDDSIAPEMYETLLTYARRDGAQIAVCDYLLVTEAGEPLPSSYRLEEDKVFDRVGALEQMNRGHFKVAWNRLYRRELLETVRFPVGKIHEDEYTAHQFYWQCERITVAAKPLYFLCAAGRQHHPYRFAPENDESGRRHFPAGLLRAGAAAHQACHRSSQDVDAGVCAGPQAEGPAAGAAAVVRRDARPDERAGKDPAEKRERLAGRPDQVPTVPLFSNAVPRGAADQKLDEQDRFLKKEIDKTPKNGYILCINAMKKSVHRRQLSREPGQVKAGKCAEMRCRF